MTKDINVGSAVVPMKATAAVPRLYRIKFRRDIMQDMQKLQDSAKKVNESGEDFQIADLEIFENVSYIMAKHADSSVPGSVEEWLDRFEVFDIYSALPQIIELWGFNMATTSESKKKAGR